MLYIYTLWRVIHCRSGIFTKFTIILCYYSGVAVIDNLVYAVGGSNRDDGTRSNLNSMERYNPEKDEWEDLPPMHRSRGAASVTALNGCLYAVGGYDSGQPRPFTCTVPIYMYTCIYVGICLQYTCICKCSQYLCMRVLKCSLFSVLMVTI